MDSLHLQIEADFVTFEVSMVHGQEMLYDNSLLQL